MEQQWSAREDAPYLRRPESRPTGWIVLAIVLLAGAGGGYYYWQHSQQAAPQPAPSVAPPALVPPQAAVEPAIRHPVEAASAEPDKPLPTLDNSDSMMREALSGLMGKAPFAELVYPAQLVRRIVATVDNLPRETAPTRVMPLQPVPGRFATVGSGEEVSMGSANSIRYAAYVRVIDALDAHALVQRYVRSYPLFQRAYEELGYPNRYFNDRLLEAIDDLLAAPEATAPVKLFQPKVQYQFADPDLEARSAGQKIMLRIGSENAAAVKAKLREIRRELFAARGAAR